MHFDQASSNISDVNLTNMTVRVSGFICPRATNTYYFYCQSNSACRLYIDNQLISETHDPTIVNNQL